VIYNAEKVISLKSPWYNFMVMNIILVIIYILGTIVVNYIIIIYMLQYVFNYYILLCIIYVSGKSHLPQSRL